MVLQNLWFVHTVCNLAVDRRIHMKCINVDQTQPIVDQWQSGQRSCSTLVHAQHSRTITGLYSSPI